MAEFVTRSPEQTAALGRRLAQVLPGGALIAFTGGLGAGPTALCPGPAQGLGGARPGTRPPPRRR